MRGVTFGNKHSYRTWGLMLKHDPVFALPNPKIKLIEVPGSDKVIDLTESLTGAVHYGTRKGRFEFVIVGQRQNWQSTYSEIANSIHGKRMKIVMDDDPNYYYEGRVAVDPFESNEATATIIITAEVEPYKKARYKIGRRL